MAGQKSAENWRSMTYVRKELLCDARSGSPLVFKGIGFLGLVCGRVANVPVIAAVLPALASCACPHPAARGAV